MPLPKGDILRKIAEKELDASFRELDRVTRDEYATSLVRQWVTNGGVAVIPTADHDLWFRVTPLEDGKTQVVRKIEKGNFSEHLRRSRVIENQIPRLLHGLRRATATSGRTGESDVPHRIRSG